MARRMLAIARSVALLAAVLAVGAGVLSGSVGAQTPGATKSFDEARGTLPWPVEGLQVQAFGEKTIHGGPSLGIAIKARPGARVVSPCEGLVVFAGEFKTYGNLVIVSPGSGYHCLFAGLSTIDAQVGQSLSAGEPIGALGGGAPVLFLELRKDRQPIDPAPWLRRRS